MASELPAPAPAAAPPPVQDQPTEDPSLRPAGERDLHPAVEAEPEGFYGGVVGGESPSPFAAALLLVALGGLIAGALGAGVEWWIVGIVFLVAALLVAGFGGRETSLP